MPNPSGATATFAGPTTLCLGHDTKRRDRTSHRRGLPAHGYSSPSPHLPIQTIQTIISCSFWRERRKIYVDELLLLLQGLIFSLRPAQLTSASSVILRFFFFSVYPPNFSYVFPTFSTSQTFESIYVKVYCIHNCHCISPEQPRPPSRDEIVVCPFSESKKKVWA